MKNTRSRTSNSGHSRQIVRTKELLHRALASLVHEKPWDDIVVKEILARADVGRSTFYTHFADKDALLGSGLREIVGATDHEPPPTALDASEQVLAFSLPLLEHVEGVRRAGRVTLSSSGYAPLHGGLQPVLVELIAENLAQIAAARRTPGPPVNLVARQLASMFLLTLEWWIDLPHPRSAREADEVFRTLAQPVVDTFGGLPRSLR